MFGEIEVDLRLLEDCRRCQGTGEIYDEQIRDMATCTTCKGTRQKLSADGYEAVRLLLWIDKMGGLDELTRIP